MEKNALDLAGLAEQVQQIAIEAGKAIMTIYGDLSLFEVTSKSDESPLTRADILSNQVIIDGLKKLSGNFPIVSEESNMIDYSTRRHFDYFWMVDPLDGTKEFIKRNGEFTVNIALIHLDHPVLGVVYVPASKELYWAYKKGGAHYREGGNYQVLEAPSYKESDRELRVVCSRSHINGATQDFIDQLNSPQTVSRGSSLKFLLLAQGMAEVYPRLGPTMEWDTAAAHIILQESGGSVINFDTGKQLEYNKENLLNPYFIARANLLPDG